MLYESTLHEAMMTSRGDAVYQCPWNTTINLHHVASSDPAEVAELTLWDVQLQAFTADSGSDNSKTCTRTTFYTSHCITTACDSIHSTSSVCDICATIMYSIH